MNRDETLAGKVAAELTGTTQLKLGVACRHSVVGRGESELKARAANQLVSMSPVVKKRRVDQPIRTESAESVTDWAKRFLPILNREAWENTEIL